MSDQAVKQAASHMFSLVKRELDGDQGAREEFQKSMNFLATCGRTLGKDWTKVAKQMQSESEKNKDLPKIILTNYGDVPVGITFQRTDQNMPLSLLDRLNPFRITGTTHYMDRQTTGAMLQPLSEDSKEACRVMDPQRGKNRFPAGTPRG